MTIRDFRNPYEYDEFGSTIWQSPVIYVTAPRLDIYNLNMPLFYETGKLLESRHGCIPILPTDIDKETKFKSIGEPEDRELISENLRALCVFANAVVVRGMNHHVRAEIAVAEAVGIPVFYALGDMPSGEWWASEWRQEEWQAERKIPAPDKVDGSDLLFTDWLDNFRARIRLNYGLRKS